MNTQTTSTAVSAAQDAGGQYSTKGLERVLSRSDLFGIAVGQIIGAGIMSMTGIAIGMTGRAIFFAFLLAAVLTIIIAVPLIFCGSVIRMRGGMYTQAHVFLGSKSAGALTLIFIAQNVTIAIYALTFADYFMSLLPGINKTVVSVIFLTTFYVTNLFGIKGAAKIQKVMVFFLASALAIFTGAGIFQVQPGFFAPEGMFMGGFGGFLNATALLSFAVGGAFVIINFGAEAKNPTRDIPFAIITSTVLVGILYALMSIVAAGVLPVRDVAFAPLSVVANVILPKPLFVFFVVGGALFALCTHLNAVFGWVTKPVLQACCDGWLPRSLGAINEKYKTPHWLLTVFYIVGLIPILTGVSMEAIANLFLLLYFVQTGILTLGTFRLPKLFPEQWKRSPYHISDPVFYTLMALALVVTIFQSWVAAREMSTGVIWANVAFIAGTYLYAYWREKSGCVSMEVSHEEL